MTALSLYRGVSAEEFELLTSAKYRWSRKIWEMILKARAKRDFHYPAKLDSEIRELARICRLERQHFTDNPKIATAYARRSNGLLIEIRVPIADLVKNFRLEFQNFGSRRKSFEIVYVVESNTLGRNRKKWKLRARKL